MFVTGRDAAAMLLLHGPLDPEQKRDAGDEFPLGRPAVLETGSGLVGDLTLVFAQNGSDGYALAR